ncbi:MAG: hypothetical protein WD314_09275 [Trueperaceae bacterium]
MSGSDLLFGIASFPLDPPLGLELDGYADRTGTAGDCLDLLMGRVWHLGNRDFELTLVVLEVLGVSRPWVEHVKALLPKVRSDRRALSLIAATHTHAGPKGFAEYPTSVEAEMQYAERVAEKVAEAAAAARNVRREARVSVRRFPLTGVASNRLEPDSSAAGSGLAVRLTNPEDGSLLGTLLSVGCHSTVLDASNLAYSGDLFGAVARELEARTGASCAVLTGAAADVSTRFVRRESSHGEALRLGRRLATLATEASGVTAIPDGNGVELALLSRIVHVPTRELPAPEQAEAALAEAEAAYSRAREDGVCDPRLRVAWTRLQGARQQWKLVSGADFPEQVSFELGGVRIGGAVLVTSPAEVPDTSFREWSRGWKEWRPWALATLANGYEGYFPVGGANTYETMVARFDQTSSDVFGGTVREILVELSATK